MTDAGKVAGLDEAEMGASMPLGRLGTPGDMARMIVFFASDAASFISGETMSVCGGPDIGGMDLK